MHLECPHCQTSYDITRDVEDTVFVCHRCGLEFSSTDSSGSENGQPEQAPVRKTAHIWPWFMVVMLLVAGSGFWLQKDAWLDNRWFRSTLINSGVDISLRAKDWQIIAGSVQSAWIVRNDGSKVLLVRGNIKNMLASDILLPKIEITFFSKTGQGKQIATSSFEIGLPPSDKVVRQVPYSRPARDNMPVRALGSRSFTILVESVSEETGNFTLKPDISPSE
ncbi:MAG: DUF3426 domain-containing protein [Mariprofundus sp.]|nr:DUF3426 domain-containing protein [Mariprofundus sp.]